MTWKAIVHSAIGTSHQREQMVCQDVGGYFVVQNILIGAVADGAGSAKSSEIGAEIAVKTAISFLKKWVECRSDQQQLLSLTHSISDQEAEKIFSDTLNEVVDSLQEKEKDGYFLKDLACTLLVFVAAPQWIAAMQIGDGFIVVRLKQSKDYQLLFLPKKGEYVNETIFVTSRDAQSQMQVRVLPGHQKFICASTDGLERLAINMQNCSPYYKFFKPFEKGIVSRNIKQESESLKEWLQSKKVNEKTDDDKTLLVCLFQSPRLLTPVSYRKKIPSDLYAQLFIVSAIAGLAANCQYHYFANFPLTSLGLSILIVILSYYNIICFRLLNLIHIHKRTQKYKVILFRQVIICSVGLILGGLCFYLINLFYYTPALPLSQHEYLSR